MKFIDLLQTVSALSGVAMILIASGWLKASIKNHLMQSSGNCR